MTLDEIQRNLEIAIQDETASYQEVARTARQIRALITVAMAASDYYYSRTWDPITEEFEHYMPGTDGYKLQKALLALESL